MSVSSLQDLDSAAIGSTEKVLRTTSSLSMTRIEQPSRGSATIAIMPSTAARPAATEHIPYYSRYIDMVSGEDAMSALKNQLGETIVFLKRITDHESMLRYEPGKWSVREVLGHMIDTERIFAYRALRIARGDATPLAGFEQDDYIKGASFDNIAWSALIEEFELVRQANILMFSGLTEEAWKRSGTANNAAITVRAIAWIIAGHELHHRKVIEEKYLAR